MAFDYHLRQQELARLMLHKARQDYQAVHSLLPQTVVADEIVGFHVQQTIEKSFKAVLIRHGVDYDYTHDLAALYEQIEVVGLHPPVPLDTVDNFTPFAVRFRYMPLEGPVEFDRVANAALAEAIITWAHQVVETPPNPTETET